jgi:hypothetical protein
MFFQIAVDFFHGFDYNTNEIAGIWCESIKRN